MKDKTIKAAERLIKDKKLLVIVLLGAVAVLLLMLSELFDGSKQAEDTVKTETVAQDIQTYSENIEKRLEDIICLIDGAGETKVMVTVESGEQQVYAENVKTDSDSSSGSSSIDSEYIVIESDGDEHGLPVKIIQPEIRGVAVVCEGARSPKVEMEVTETVSAALGISSAKISVAMMKID